MQNNKKRHISDCLVICSGLIIAGIITEQTYFFYISASLGIVCALVNPIAFAVSFLWEWIGKILGFVVSKIILSIIFYCILFPFSIFFKLFAKNKSISNKKSTTYWIKKEKENIDFTKLW
jgi:hypothetical protein